VTDTTTRPPPDTPPVLVARGVTRSFDHGRVVPLAGVDLTVHRGELLGIVGSSGSGKTTLLNLLGLLDRPDDGDVMVDGVPTAALSENERTTLRARKLGFVFQDSLVDPRRTARENVVLALTFAGIPRADRNAAALAALAETDVAHRADLLAGDLSGGERQRVAVARAVAHRPQVLLCDEPTGNLDAANTERVFSLLLAYAKAGVGVALVTHDLDLARRCTTAVRVADGALQPW